MGWAAVILISRAFLKVIASWENGEKKIIIEVGHSVFFTHRTHSLPCALHPNPISIQQNGENTEVKLNTWEEWKRGKYLQAKYCHSETTLISHQRL